MKIEYQDYGAVANIVITSPCLNSGSITGLSILLFFNLRNSCKP